MSALGAFVAAEGEPSPTPTGPDTVPLELWEASPGIYGFLFFFAVACALIVLVRSMLRHSRKVEQNARLREEAEARAEAEAAGAAGAGGADAAGGAGEPEGSSADQHEPGP